MSRILKLKCAKCGREYDLEKKVCLCENRDDGRLDIIYDYETVKHLFKSKRKGNSDGIWRYRELLPIDQERAMITLGEGDTPLIKAERLARELGMTGLYLKDETGNPTGSFKDRSMAVGVSKALEFDVSTVVTASSGNAAAALAAYSARAGLACYAFVPENAPQEKVSQILLYGANVFRTRRDSASGDPTIRALRIAVDEFGWYPCPSFGPFNPYQVEGPKTISYELVEQLRGNSPDWIMIPVGAACLLAGIWKGFRDLYALGMINELPRLVAVQPSGNAPLVKAFKHASTVFEKEHFRKTHTIADALSDPFPWDGDAGLAALKDTKGLAEEVSDKELLDAEKLLASKEGLFASPSGVAGLAGLRKLRNAGVIDGKDTVVVLVTDTGFKNLSVLDSLGRKCRTINPTFEDLRRIERG
jgi:threonine synthase